jgi:N-acyl-L-homoserine lactone synthetase
MYRLRYQVYCQEKEFLDAADCPDGREIDELDVCAAHFVLVDTAAPGKVLGCFRLIPANPLGLPMAHSMEITASLPPETDAVEVSRLILGRDCRTNSLPILLMLREVYRYGIEHDVGHVYTIIEPRFAVLLDRLGFRPELVGRPRHYMNGVNAPYVFDLRRFRDGLPAVNPRFHALIREAGIEELCHAMV